VNQRSGTGTVEIAAGRVEGLLLEGSPAGDEPASRPARWRWAVDAAVLLGLAGVAITQPLLDLLGRNPTFFVAGHYESNQIVWFCLIVALVPGAAVFALTAVAGLPRPGLAPLSHGLGVAGLAGLCGLMLCRSFRLDGLVYVVPVVVALGALVAVVEWRSRLVRQFLAWLALGNLAFVVLFLTSSPTSGLLWSARAAEGELGHVSVPPLSGPVVVVVLDEFPVTAIMRGDGSLIDTRYPNLARLAGQSTWFRNAASESAKTYVSTSELLTGVRASPDDMPVLADHPRNWFTLFGDAYPVNRYELVTDLCPPEACEPQPARPLTRLLDDASVVYRHRVLPPDLREGLPAIDTGWGDFGEAVGDDGGAAAATPPPTATPGSMDEYRRKPKEEVGVRGQVAVFRRQIEALGAEPSLNFIHVKLPHNPYGLTPWGEGTLPVAQRPDGSRIDPLKAAPPGDPAHDFLFRLIYPIQAMQLGAVDALVGEMIDRLESTGAWDEALVVVTSDHGQDMTAPGFTRVEDATNTDELFRIPLFVKAPGQHEGRVVDDRASTVDILPSMIDLLDIETDWELEGHSLYDGSESVIENHVQTDVEAAFRVAAAHVAKFPRGEDWVALAAVGEGEDLVGDRVSDHQVGDPSALQWAPDEAAVLDDLSLATDDVPYLMGGTVAGDGARPPELVVGVNGTVAGTIGGYRPEGERWRFSGYIAPFFVDGRNEVVAYEVARGPAGVVLHPVSGG
jgi:Sulfatase